MYGLLISHACNVWDWTLEMDLYGIRLVPARLSQGWLSSPAPLMALIHDPGLVPARPQPAMPLTSSELAASHRPPPAARAVPVATGDAVTS